MLNPHYSHIIRSKIHLMVKNNMRPTIQTCKIDNTSRFENYKSLKYNHMNVEQICDTILSDIESCAQDYPERYINLIGYSFNQEIHNEYISDIYVIKHPGGHPVNPQADCVSIADVPYSPLRLSDITPPLSGA